jgi:hypothetical protein
MSSLDILALSPSNQPMPYSKFTLSRAVEDFDLTVREDANLFADIEPVVPTSLLREILIENVPWAIAVGSEKARSEGIINPVLLEVKRQLGGQVGVFSGEEFNVDVAADLNGFCDFLVSRSSEQLYIKAPVLILVEAKKEDLKPALGQCLAEMVAAQRFNASKGQTVKTIYGVVTSGTVWRFLQLTEQVVSIDLTDYPLLPVDNVLGVLVWMLRID